MEGLAETLKSIVISSQDHLTEAYIIQPLSSFVDRLYLIILIF